MTNQWLRCLPCLVSLYGGAPACGDDDGAADAAPDVSAEADRGETTADVGLDGLVDDGAGPDDGSGAEYAADVDRPDDAGGGDLGEDAWDDVPPGDVTA
ncbi:MAG: hypothetical protein JXB32_14730, partial [Deltaproteobacteria bacterium]|nr:hypothetical protein [Deltaproteobacteria bacterium]